MSWRPHLRAAAGRMADASVPDAMRDARLLLAHVLGIAPDRLTLHLDDPVRPDLLGGFERLVAARTARRPLSHLTGQRLFWGRAFHVTPDVLDPRPETETLVALALAEPFARVLDLGTGSGAILLSLLADRPGATGVGADVSPAALAVAQHNAQSLGLLDRARMVLSDWCADITGQFDLIVSNPPYIALSEMPSLSPEVREHEPHLALTDGGDGLRAYRDIASQACANLRPEGRLLVEIGATQGADVVKILVAAGFVGVAIHPDLDGRDRVVAARAP
ncbi:[protein release factor]-glutamine N5-methyltransferase [Gemmobacter megaterium]|uniref:Release factor glutamine methyltransferase n=1 Tax=Gemmobacter megaterium TaxID=1086013 RepID=A0A1N7K6I3_9RHOB|nr:peptide chain release factor N(5)-glutamine methyltransferase [Gemmobacter megaterium]GGE00602.1 release factor glutamine methyltransferase [Gemmobacter megaterium]SIS57203.1 [protein release factor]-glutamine N5-methyltransferase [Gemmobacter megaterium]